MRELARGRNETLSVSASSHTAQARVTSRGTSTSEGHEAGLEKLRSRLHPTIEKRTEVASGETFSAATASVIVVAVAAGSD